MTTAICNEIRLKKNRIQGSIGSIYFGGGTPSVLRLNHLQQIFDALTSNFSISTDAEITLEANPDDLTAKKITELRTLPVNRFSIGTQSFFDEDLLWMNRAHHAEEAVSSIKRAQDAGFENLSIDLIYGFPLLTDEKWQSNIQKAIELRTPHLSAYALTVEGKTALAHAIAKGKQPDVSDEQSAAQFLRLTEMLSNAGFEHYEISNYSLPGKYAVHNTNYWKGIPYLGIGPSAHGFDGRTRHHNIANNARYVSALGREELPELIEELSITDRFNEYVMTSLRTMWGTSLLHIEQEFGSHFVDQVKHDVAPFLANGEVVEERNTLYLSSKGKLFADGIASALFTVEE